MSLFWSIVGGLVLLFGCVGSFLSGRIDTMIVGGISSIIAGMACFTAASLLNRMQDIAEAVAEMREQKK